MDCQQCVSVDTTALSPERLRILEMCEKLPTDSLRAVELFLSALVLCKKDCPRALTMRKYLLDLAGIVADYVPQILAESVTA